MSAQPWRDTTDEYAAPPRAAAPLLDSRRPQTTPLSRALNITYFRHAVEKMPTIDIIWATEMRAAYYSIEHTTLRHATPLN